MPIIPNFLVPREVLQSRPPQDMRTYFDIIWSCLSTLFICTWVAVHPNIPARGEGHIRSLWRRIKLMLWMLVVPEFVLIWAYRQWSAARLIAGFFRDEGWTPTHGHFLIMGGFTYFDGEVECVLDFDQFCKLLGSESGVPQVSFPTITAAEIQDKSRGDFLSKAIVILQSLWFIIHCIARGKQGLALTELELVTLALASLNGVMYYFWWYKPLGVNEAVKLYRKGKEPAEKIIGSWSERRTPSQRSLVQSLILCPLQELRSSIPQLLEDLKTGLLNCFGQISTKLSSVSRFTITEFINDQRDKLNFPGDARLWSLYLPIKWFLVNPIMALFDILFATATTKTLKSRAAQVPTFYAPRMDSSIKSDDLLLFVLPPIAVVFGALHCIAWNFHFPSPNERLSWRIASLAITLIPAAPLVFFFILFLFFDLLPGLLKFIKGRYDLDLSIDLPRTMTKIVKNLLLGIGAFLAGAGLVAYMLARFLLLAQAIILLRRQPESAFYTVDWAKFLPHIQ